MLHPVEHRQRDHLSAVDALLVEERDPGIGALISHGTNPVLVHRPRAWPALEQRFEVIMDATPHDHVEPNADDLQRIRDAVLGSDDDVEPPHHQPAP